MVMEGAADGSGSTGTESGAGATGAAEGAASSGAGSAGAQGAAPAAGAATAQPGTAAAGAVGDGAAAAKYTPNFKYKVTAPQGGAAAKLEKEIPEWARPFITSQDLEKNVRELFEKSEGIDAVKQHRDQLVSENTAMREQWAPVVQQVQTLQGHLQRGDLDSFFEGCNLSEQQILKYALYRLQLRENPQAMQTHEQTRQLQLQNQAYQQQLQEVSSGYQNLAVQQRTMQLDSHLGRPEILPAAQSFDARVGRPGAFRDEVIKRGKLYASMGQDVAVEQVANEVLQLIGWSGQNNQAAQGAGATAMGAGAAGATAGQPAATLPSVKGRGTSPAKKVIKSTDQLRELARSRA